MKKVAILLLVILYAAEAGAQPLPAKLKHTIVIDTDCAIDDMRAISLLLSRPEITVKAILVSDGTLPPAEGIIKVRSLLSAFNCEDILVATGETLKNVNPPWREFNRQISWGTAVVSQHVALDAVECLNGILDKTEEKIILVCLGPLTNIAGMIGSNNKKLSKIERILWYNDAVYPLRGFNFLCDTVSVNKVIAAGIRMDVISNLNKQDAFFDSSLVAVSAKSNMPFAAEINHVYSQPQVIEKLKQNHFKLSDDLVAIYVTNPYLFDMNIRLHKPGIRFDQDYDVQGIREVITDMLNGVYVAENNVVFNRFPDKREMFDYDVRPIMDSAIARYGMEEWKANVMTDEFHGHLGVFSIVGAKMGIKAREYFGVGPDELNVMSFAGERPPYSCLNDGIQVSTGATVGMGTIHLASDSIYRPSAIFTFKDRSLRITLKKEYLNEVNNDINEGIVKYGLMDDGYWKLIRRNALKYWMEWDRNKIFELEEIVSATGVGINR